MNYQEVAVNIQIHIGTCWRAYRFGGPDIHQEAEGL